MKTKKTFDCVEMKRQAQTQNYEATKHMSDEQRAAYVREKARSGRFRDFWERMDKRNRDEGEQSS